MFYSWHNNGQYWYQGDRNSKGQEDGKGIIISSQSGLEIGWFKDGQKYGDFINVYADGWITIVQYNN